MISSIDDLVLVLGGVHLARGFEEDAGQRLHDVGLVHHGHLLAPLPDGVVEGEATMRRQPWRVLMPVDMPTAWGSPSIGM
jgi:hypothetical protein